MYADDTSISASSENPLQVLEHLKRDIEGIMDWLRQNKLSLDVAKCEYMFTGNDKQLSKSKISDTGNLETDKDEIKRVSKTKYLGLTIDESLSWSQQYKIERRAQFHQKTQRDITTITAVSCLPSVNRKPPEIRKLDMGSLVRKNSAHCRRYKTGHFILLS